MSVELLYTSAAQGLKQGSRGFCTVLSTTGMPVNLATRLESLSAYRHVFPPSHPDAAQNPISFSHLRINVGGRPLSILSRISDYGVDYSQRTNKLAHHVVLEGVDLVPAGPAWVMSQPSIMRSQWDGQCATPGAGPTIPTTNQSPRVCLRWSGLCSDAGWGGVVAEAFAQPTGKPLWIIFTLAQSSDLLGMINESIALLPVEQRWQATFSTFATNLPPDADCKVRCVLAGTEDARLAPARGKVIDLSKPLPTIAPTATTAYVLAARNGSPMPTAGVSLRVAAPSSKTHPSSAATESGEDGFDEDQPNPAVATLPPPKSPSASELRVAKTESIPLAPGIPSASVKSENFEVSEASNQTLKSVVIALSVVATLLLATTIFLLVQRQPTAIAPVIGKDDPSTATRDAVSSDTADTAATTSNSNVPANQVVRGSTTDREPSFTNDNAATRREDLEPKSTVTSLKPSFDDLSLNNRLANELDPPALAPSVNESTTADASGSKSRDEITSPPAESNTRSENSTVVTGKLRMKQLLDGQVVVAIRIPMPEGYSFNRARYVFSKNDEPKELLGTISLETQSHLKHIKRLAGKPTEFDVDLDPKSASLQASAVAIKKAWEELKRSNDVRQEWITANAQTYAKMLAIDFPEPADSINDFVVQLKTLQTAVSKCRSVLSNEKKKLTDAATNTKLNSNLRRIQLFENQLKPLEEPLENLLSQLSEMRNLGGEFDTGTILLLRQIDASSSSDITFHALRAIYSIEELGSGQSGERTND